MPIEPHLLHPAVVHLPLALLPTGAAAAVAASRRRGPAWLGEAASWLLWLGTASAWLALSLGLVAERWAPHVPPAWEAMADHETLAWWSAGLFTALSVWRYRLGKKWEPAFLAAWLTALGVLAATAWHGGELVFRYGVGHIGF